MPLRILKPPPDSDEVLKSSLAQLSAVKARDLRFLSLDADTLKSARTTLEHPVYTIGVQDIAAGKSIADATLVSWRYIVPNQKKNAAAAEVNVKGDRHTFSGLNEGRFGQEFANIVSSVSDNPELMTQDFELRALRIPALHFFAVWLKGDGMNDVLIPMGDEVPGLIARNRYSITKVDEALQPEAKKSLQFNDRPARSETSGGS